MLLVVAAAAPRLLGALRRPAAAESMASAAIDWLSTLDADQKSKAVRPFASPSRTDWHFVPKNDRKGLQLRDMNDRQEEAALALVRSSLSQAGYDKSITIMKLDEILRRLEGDKAKNIRDPKRYFLTIFGTPADEGSWGLSVEGHHLSLNFTVRDGVLVDSTPQFMGANPAEVKTTFDGLPAARRTAAGEGRDREGTAEGDPRGGSGAATGGAAGRDSFPGAFGEAAVAPAAARGDLLRGDARRGRGRPAAAHRVGRWFGRGAGRVGTQ
jgi:hypothetical protein